MLDHPTGAVERPLLAAEGTPPSAPSFSDLGLSAALAATLEDEGYTRPTPIQAQAIPPLLEGRDLLGVAQTGTGKTAAFALPLIERLLARPERPAPGRPRALVLTPTRELAAQVVSRFDAYGRGTPLRHTVVFGGVGQSPQVRALRRGVDVLVATPGRLLDLMGQRHVDLGRVELFVLDEADRMLDMGFLADVRRIVATLPARRQSLLFSATMPADIVGLARSLLHDAVRVEVTPPGTPVSRISQRVYYVEKEDKRALLSSLLREGTIDRALVFTRTKHGADKVCRFLEAEGVRAAALHGNKSQGQRERALDAFRAGRLRALVATDIAARGIDVPGISHVINFDVPNDPQGYVHRIGRTARAGRDGVALAFCDRTEQAWLRDIQRATRQDLEVVQGSPCHGDIGPRPARPAARPRGFRGARRPRPSSRW